MELCPVVISKKCSNYVCSQILLYSMDLWVFNKNNEEILKKNLMTEAIEYIVNIRHYLAGLCKYMEFKNKMSFVV